MAAHASDLLAIWRAQIPIAAAMGIEIAAYENDELQVRAALAPNVNLHGTAFAGSLYSVCALAGWGAIWLQLRERRLDGHIVLAEGRIRYRQAVTEAIVCRCYFDAEAQADKVAELLSTRKCVFELACTVDTGQGRAVAFEGRYAVKLAAGELD